MGTPTDSQPRATIEIDRVQDLPRRYTSGLEGVTRFRGQNTDRPLMPRLGRLAAQLDVPTEKFRPLERMMGKLTILESLGLVRQIKFSSNVEHFLFDEPFVEYLIAAESK